MTFETLQTLFSNDAFITAVVGSGCVLIIMRFASLTKTGYLEGRMYADGARHCTCCNRLLSPNAWFCPGCGEVLETEPEISIQPLPCQSSDSNDCEDMTEFFREEPGKELVMSQESVAEPALVS